MEGATTFGGFSQGWQGGKQTVASSALFEPRLSNSAMSPHLKSLFLVNLGGPMNSCDATGSADS